MARLLRNRQHERNDERLGRLVAPPFSNVYLETMEEARSESEEPDETGNARVAGLPKREHTEGILAVAGSGILTHTITKKRLAQAGYYSILDQYESLHSND